MTQTVSAFALSSSRSSCEAYFFSPFSHHHITTVKTWPSIHHGLRRSQGPRVRHKIADNHDLVITVKGVAGYSRLVIPEGRTITVHEYEVSTANLRKNPYFRAIIGPGSANSKTPLMNCRKTTRLRRAFGSSSSTTRNPDLQ